jgi:hypothetical protein
MAKGGARKGSGRKPLAIEDNVKEAIKQALVSNGPDTLSRIWSKIISEAKKGSEKHIQIFLNYYYGKPKESVQIEGDMTLEIRRRIYK